MMVLQFYSLQSCGGLEPISVSIWWEVGKLSTSGYVASSSQGWHKEKQPLIHTFSPMGNESHQLTSIFLDCGRKLQNAAETNTDHREHANSTQTDPWWVWTLNFAVQQQCWQVDWAAPGSNLQVFSFLSLPLSSFFPTSSCQLIRDLILLWRYLSANLICSSLSVSCHFSVCV